MARLLVTGGAGFIGSNFVHYWRRAHPGDALTVLDAFTYAGQRPNLAVLAGQDGFLLVEGDICDQTLVESLLAEHHIDTLVHFAAESHVDRSLLGPGVFLKTNIEGTLSLLRAAQTVWLDDNKPHHFLHISTDEVYGPLAADAAPVTENAVYAPSSPYAASKAAADQLVHAWQQSYGLNASITLCTNNYGPRQLPEKFLPLVITHCLTGQPIPVYGDGEQIRDWLHVEDHCRALECILHKAEPGERWHIAGNIQATNLVMARGVCRSLDERFAEQPALATQYPDAPPARGASCLDLIKQVGDRPGHDRRYALNSDKIANRLGFKPGISTHQGLQSTIDWYLQNPDWWQPLLAQRMQFNWHGAD